MKSAKLLLFMITLLIVLTGCLGKRSETIELLEEGISEIQISQSTSASGVNEDITLSIDDPKSVKTFKKVITGATKEDKDNIAEPEYNVKVVYDKGEHLTHCFHLWLGERDEESAFTYIGDEIMYTTTPKSTNKLRNAILSTS